MNSCQRCRDQLGEFLDGTLSASAREEVAAHLESCPECAREKRILEATRTALQDWSPVAAPADLRLRVRTTLQNEALARQRPDFLASFDFLRPKKFVWAGTMTLSAIALLVLARPFANAPLPVPVSDSSSLQAPDVPVPEVPSPIVKSSPPKNQKSPAVRARSANGGTAPKPAPSTPRVENDSSASDSEAASPPVRGGRRAGVSQPAPLTQAPRVQERIIEAPPASTAPSASAPSASAPSASAPSASAPQPAPPTPARPVGAAKKPPLGKVQARGAIPSPLVAPPMVGSAAPVPRVGLSAPRFSETKPDTNDMAGSAPASEPLMAKSMESTAPPRFSIAISALTPSDAMRQDNGSVTANGAASVDGATSRVVPRVGMAAPSPSLRLRSSPAAPKSLGQDADREGQKVSPNADAYNFAPRPDRPTVPSLAAPPQAAPLSPSFPITSAQSARNYVLSIQSPRAVKDAQIRVVLPPSLRFDANDASGSRVVWRGDFVEDKPVNLTVSLSGGRGNEKITIFLEQKEEGQQSRPLETQTLTLPQGS